MPGRTNSEPISEYSGEDLQSVGRHALHLCPALILEGDIMMDVHEQLVAALRVIVAQSGDPQAIIAHALEDVERETPTPSSASGEETPGPYTPNAWSIFAH